MNRLPFQDLVIETIRDPREAASKLLALDLPREWLWMAMALMCILNAIVYSVTLQLSPPSPDVGGIVPPAFQSPMLFTLFLFGALVITVFVLRWLGQSLGGTASLTDILVLMTWLQVMRFLFQIVVLVLSVISLSLSAIFVLAGSIYAIYILAAFLDRAHEFGSLIKALGVMIFAIVAIAVGLSILLAVLGALVLGGTGNV